jgi:hypothetical protein
MAAHIRLPTNAPPWLPGYNGAVERAITAAAVMTPLLVAEMPAAADRPYTWIFVTNASGGAIPAFSDGTNWRRADTRAIVT